MLPRQRRRDNRVRQKSFRGLEPFRVRIFAAFALMILGFGVLGVRLLSVALLPTAEPTDFYRVAASQPQPLRGKIVDARGEVMATSLKVKSLFADPYNVMDIEEVAKKLPRVLPGLSPEEIRNDLNKNRRFVWLKRHLTPAQVYAVNALGIPGLGFREETQRFYPQKDTAAHVLGSTNYQGRGVSGAEMGAQEALSSGEDAALTVDMRLQNALHKTLADTVAQTGARGAWGVTLDAQTADILAMVSLPDYNANHYGRAPKSHWLNRTTGGVYEMGSVFKLFTHAMAIENNGMTPDQLFDCTRPLKIGNFTIHDLYPKNDWLTAKEVFVHSSNIGAAQMGEMIGAEKQQDTLSQLGLFDQHDIGVGYTAAALAPDPYRWGRVQTMSVSYGHGMAVTAVQMAAAARTVLVDGVWQQPSVLRDGFRHSPRQVFSEKTVAMMRKLAAAVVDEGTGSRAAVPGYAVGGKTGTSEKNTGGQYVRDKNLASFVGAVPLNNPRMVTFIMVDEPLEGRGGGGEVAAPAFAAFSKQALAILGVAPTKNVSTLGVLRPERTQEARFINERVNKYAPDKQFAYAADAQIIKDVR